MPDFTGGAVPVGAFGVVRKPGFKGSGGIQNQLKNPRDVGDLAGAEGAHADVGVLACATRGFRSSFPQSPYNRLQSFHVFPFQNRG